MDRTPSRRDLLRFGGLTAVAVALGACANDGGVASEPGRSAGDVGPTSSTVPPTPVSATTPLSPDLFEPLATCALTPSSIAGPFPLDEQFDRRDVTEGYPGHPVRLGFRVLDDACAPVPDAAVEIWHTDATGDYSAFFDGGGDKDEGPGTTFMRGTQRTGTDGIVEFHTIYPGWYPGRSVHIHLRVRTDDALALTTQVYFDDDYTVAVFTEDPYARFGPPQTTNAQDGFAGDPAAEGTQLATVAAGTSAGPGTLALLNLGIAASA